MVKNDQKSRKLPKLTKMVKNKLQKKSYDVSDHKERAKAYAMLTRKGFSSDEIKFALAEVEGSNE